MNPLLCLRVGYMERYDGPDAISGGGAYVKERGVGGEVFNFKPSRSRCYGYAMSRHHVGVRLEHLEGGRPWRVGDELDDVDVVFFARKPGHGQMVVGWYRGATVFHRQYRERRGRINGMDEIKRQYLCVVDMDRAVLLPEAKRTFEVPSASTGERGFPGQSNVWYPGLHLDQPKVKAFVRNLGRYLASTQGRELPPDEVPKVGNRKNGWARVDAAHNAAVERAAVQAVWEYWQKLGYRVKSVETDNVGWDLEVRRNRETLRVEVKGQSGDTVNFGMTPNEYLRLKEHGREYRVCVVLSALDTPRLYELTPCRVDTGWELISGDADGMRVTLAERVAALGVEVVA